MIARSTSRESVSRQQERIGIAMKSEINKLERKHVVEKVQLEDFFQGLVTTTK